MFRPVTRVCALLACALLALAGCDASVQTTVHVTSPAAATIAVDASFHGEAATAVRDNVKIRDAFVKVFTDRLGVSPHVVESGEAVTASAPITYRQLTGSADVTGVKSATLSDGGDGTATLALTLGDAPALVEAVRAGTADEPDGPALAKTMLQQTSIVVRVVFDGGVTAVTGQPEAVQDGDTVTFTRQASDMAGGVLAVTGRPVAAAHWMWWLVSVVAAIGGSVVWLRRRRR